MASARPVPLATTKAEWLAARQQRRMKVSRLWQGVASKASPPGRRGGDEVQLGRPSTMERQTSATRMNANKVADAVANLKRGASLGAGVTAADMPTANEVIPFGSQLGFGMGAAPHSDAAQPTGAL